MIPLTLAELAAATGAHLAGASADRHDTVVDGVVTTDSRECGPGSLYVARRGEHADGHDYADSAVAAGAVAVLGERPVGGVPTLVTDDVQTAFGRVARAVVDRAPDLTIVGVTGSSGKTTVKDLLSAVLGTRGPTVAPVNSLNGEIGVPLTVCRIEESTRFLVAEMGARGVGHLTYLTTIAPPQVAVVLNVGLAHVGEFGSVDNIALAKSELPRAVPAEGLAVLNRDDPAVTAMAEGLACRVVMVGEHDEADLRAVDVTLDARGRASYTAGGPRRARRPPVTLAQPGRHQVGNSLSVLAAALEVGVPLEQAVETLATAGPASRWRMEVTERPDGVTVVNDAYNANPDSVRAALRALADMEVAGRRVAVLGGMLELGAASEEQHRATGAAAAELGVDLLVGVGELARDVVAGFEAGSGDGETRWVGDTDTAHDLLGTLLRPGDVVLLKSSRDSGLRWLGDRLAGTGPEPQPQDALRPQWPRRARPGAAGRTGWPWSGEEQQRMRAILFGGGLALLVSLLGTRVAIRAFTQLGYGQEIRDDGPTTHHTKRGTPTMGGVVIILATLIGYFAAKLITLDLPTASGLLLLFLFVGCGVVGFLDDYIKIVKQRSLGLRSKAKMIGLTVGGRRLRRPLAAPRARGRTRRDAGVPPHLLHPRLRGVHAAGDRRGAADLADRRRHQQRGQPRRRSRRPGHRARR